MTENNTAEKPLTTLAKNDHSFGKNIYDCIATAVGWIAEFENLIGSSSKLHDLAVENARADIAL